MSDVRLYREGLGWSLARQCAAEVLGAADFSTNGVAQVIRSHPDIVIIDIGAHGSFDMAKSLRKRMPATKIVAFAVSETDHLVLACAEAGISSYVAPDASEEDLVAAINCAMRGELFCSPRIAALLFHKVAAMSPPRPRPDLSEGLTHRECEILSLLSDGLQNKEIGRILRIGDSTVKNHVHNILGKLQVSRRGEAAARHRVSVAHKATPSATHRRGRIPQSEERRATVSE